MRQAADNETSPAAIRKRAYVLLTLDREDNLNVETIAQLHGVSAATAYRLRRQYLREGLNAVLPDRKPEPPQSPKKRSMFILPDEDRACAQQAADNEANSELIRKRARVLLSLDREYNLNVEAIAQQHGISAATVNLLKKRYRREGLDAVLADRRKNNRGSRRRKCCLLAMPEEDRALARKTADDESVPEHIRRYARILLGLNNPEEGIRGLPDVAQQNGVSLGTVNRVKKWYLQDGLEAVLREKKKPAPEPKKQAPEPEWISLFPLPEEIGVLVRQAAEDADYPEHLRRYARILLSLGHHDILEVACQQGISRSTVYHVIDLYAQGGVSAAIGQRVVQRPDRRPRTRRVPQLRLTDAESTFTQAVAKNADHPGYIRRRAKILLDLSGASAACHVEKIAETHLVSAATVRIIEKQYLQGGLPAVFPFYDAD